MNKEKLTATPPRLRLRISAAAQKVLRSGNPWLFEGSIQQQNRPGELGELAVIYDRNDRFLALGLYDPESPIRVRILRVGRPEAVNEDWWLRRLEAALDRRQGLFDSRTTAHRWIHGESDGWPGLVLDTYAGTLVLKLYTAAWLPWLGLTTALIRRRLHPERIVLRLSRNIQATVRKRFHKLDGQLLSGPAIKKPVLFLETGLQFEADVLHGQKTGFFLDQRENRRRVEGLSSGREVLNAFSFSGGFSLYAARGGARSVTDLDISAHALSSSRENFALNSQNAALKSCRHELIQAEAFEWLDQNRRRKFDLIVLDPPAFAKGRAERTGALRAYRALVAATLEHIRPSGILLACSCSAQVSAEEFFGVVREAAATRGFLELGTTGHPPDHPATFKEAAYLKAIYVSFPR